METEDSTQVKEAVKENTGEKTDNIVFIGKKPAMSYVLAVMTQFTNDMKEVYIKARGRSISRAVDVAEIVKNKFLKDVKREIEIGTEQMTDKEDQTRKFNVSTINIKLFKE